MVEYMVEYIVEIDLVGVLQVVLKSRGGKEAALPSILGARLILSTNQAGKYDQIRPPYSP